jgi:dihydroorotate dehydrogenase
MTENPLYTKLLRPALFQMEAESAHRFAHDCARFATPLWPALSDAFVYHGSDLEVNLCGVQLANPIGLAAGFDKNGELTEILGHIGFGFTEVGSITAKPSAGNPKPRLFRLPEDEALINRMGLNGEGADAICQRLAVAKYCLPVGVNIAKTNDPAIDGNAAVEDILYSFGKAQALPIAYITINASCPNTAEGMMEEKSRLEIIFAEIKKLNARSLPVFVKLSPDSTDTLISDIVEAATNNGLAGYVCGNTTVSRENLNTTDEKIKAIGNGGLSGKPLRQLALNLCQKVNRLKSKEQVIIACGGIASGKDAFQFISAGATALQLYSALIYRGPTLPKEICAELSDILKAKGLTLAEAIGQAVSLSS